MQKSADIARNGRPLNLLSVVMPVRNEAGCIEDTVQHLCLELQSNKVPYEIVVIDDDNDDRTWSILQGLASGNSAIRPVKNKGPHGFGRAIVMGIYASCGDAVVVMMADESDDCRDIVRYWQVLNEK